MTPIKKTVLITTILMLSEICYALENWALKYNDWTCIGKPFYQNQYTGDQLLGWKYNSFECTFERKFSLEKEDYAAYISIPECDFNTKLQNSLTIELYKFKGSAPDIEKTYSKLDYSANKVLDFSFMLDQQDNKISISSFADDQKVSFLQRLQTSRYLILFFDGKAIAVSNDDINKAIPEKCGFL